MKHSPLWQVSVSATSDTEDEIFHLLETAFAQSPASCHNAKTDAITVMAYLEKLPPAAISSLRKQLARLRAHAPVRLRVKRLPRENWAESWKRHFHPIDIDGRLLIKPSWSRRGPRAGQDLVVLDPGLSFGTGQHPTTLFCLQQLVRRRKPACPQSFLDIGTGSAILALAAAKLGYCPVAAWENDPEAVRAARQNIRSNRLQKQIRLCHADLRAAPEKAGRRYDVICANLLADLLLAEAEKIRNLLASGGILVVAGILRREFKKIRVKLHNLRLTFLQSGGNEEWKSGVFTLRD